MAAISSTVLTFVKPGDRIVAVKHLYPDAYRLFQTLLARLDISVTYVDGKDQDAVMEALPGAVLFYMESPTSWIMEPHDVRALATLAQARGRHQCHRQFLGDADLSAPDHPRGRSGAAFRFEVSRRPQRRGSRAWSPAPRPWVDKIRMQTLPYLGGKLSPFDAGC